MKMLSWDNFENCLALWSGCKKTKNSVCEYVLLFRANQEPHPRNWIKMAFKIYPCVGLLLKAITFQMSPTKFASFSSVILQNNVCMLYTWGWFVVFISLSILLFYRMVDYNSTSRNEKNRGIFSADSKTKTLWLMHWWGPTEAIPLWNQYYFGWTIWHQSPEDMTRAWSGQWEKIQELRNLEYRLIKVR